MHLQDVKTLTEGAFIERKRRRGSLFRFPSRLGFGKINLISTLPF